MEDFIPIVVQYGNLSVKKSDEKKLILESDTFSIVIQTRWNNREKIFLLTAFDLRKKPVKVKIVKENGVWKIADFIRDGVSELHEMQDYIAADAEL